ncbi:MAG TPA: CHASE3 domain-containing protein [Chthoniobacteraceae bacterium]|nr:CHASE3 domain-containing protein [Chthoniobacteraceae bacterium]
MASPANGRFRFSTYQIILGFCVALLLMLLRSVVAYNNAATFLETTKKVAHTHEVLEDHAVLLRDLMEAESAERGYIILGENGYLQAHDAASEATLRDLEKLALLTRDNPEQQKYVTELEPLIHQKLDIMKRNITEREIEGEKMAPEIYAKSGGSEFMGEIRKKMVAFENVQRAQLARDINSFEKNGKNAITYVGFGTVVAGLFLCAALWLVIRDMSARRLAEEDLAEERTLLSVLIETIPHQVYVKDLEGRFVMDNAAHRRYLGVADIEAVNGTRTSDYFTQEIAKEDMESDRKVMVHEDHMLDREEPGVDRKGNLLWLSTTKIPLYDSEGKVVGLLALSEDITERRHAEEKLRHNAEQMERSNKELEEFASIASHDLQEPLRKILAFGTRLKTTCGPALGEQGNDYLDRMSNAAERMQTLISDLLTLSRVTSTARPFKTVDLEQVAKEVISDLEVQIEQTGAEVEIGFLPEIEADPVQMRQLFQNLLSNALKFHRKNQKPSVSVSGKIVEMKDYQLPGVVPGGNACRIMVKDNGIGFSKDYSDKIFALFQRLHSWAEYEGTGIGLAVCRKITDRHGGNIVAKSSEGDGATFIVTLPVKQTTNNNHE